VSMVQLVALVSSAAVLAAVVLALVWQRSWLRRRSGERVVVHTTTERSLEGTLVTVAPDGLVLVGARYLDDEVDLGAEVYVPRARVAWMQVGR
jgi:CubicO group peptidase (beta-lactamase class C family)